MFGKLAAILVDFGAMDFALGPIFGEFGLVGHFLFPIARQPLPFPALLVGSRNDPYCSFERAEALAQAWGARFVDYGERGHINADSGLADWDEGHGWLQSLAAPAAAVHAP